MPFRESVGLQMWAPRQRACGPRMAPVPSPSLWALRPALIWWDRLLWGLGRTRDVGVTSPGPDLKGWLCAPSPSWRCRGCSAFVLGAGRWAAHWGLLQQSCLAQPSSTRPPMHGSHQGVPQGPRGCRSALFLLCIERTGPARPVRLPFTSADQDEAAVRALLIMCPLRVTFGTDPAASRRLRETGGAGSPVALRDWRGLRGLSRTETPEGARVGRVCRDSGARGGDVLSARGWLSIPMQREVGGFYVHEFQVAILESSEVLGEELRDMFMIVK